MSFRRIINILNFRRNPLPLDDCVLGFTEDDVKFLESLDKEGLIQLKLEIAEAWGFKDDQIIEDILDDAYFEITQSLEAQEMVKLNDFMIQYINMPEGCVSLENLNIFKEGENSKSFDNAVISAATLIDKFGRVFYDSNVNSRGSEGECRKIFAMRITITCIGSMAGMLLPGPGWAVVAAAVCDAASAAADYANCLG